MTFVGDLLKLCSCLIKFAQQPGASLTKEPSVTFMGVLSKCAIMSIEPAVGVLREG